MVEQARCMVWVLVLRRLVALLPCTLAPCMVSGLCPSHGVYVVSGVGISTLRVDLLPCMV